MTQFARRALIDQALAKRALSEAVEGVQEPAGLAKRAVTEVLARRAEAAPLNAETGCARRALDPEQPRRVLVDDQARHALEGPRRVLDPAEVLTARRALDIAGARRTLVESGEPLAGLAAPVVAAAMPNTHRFGRGLQVLVGVIAAITSLSLIILGPIQSLTLAAPANAGTSGPTAQAPVSQTRPTMIPLSVAEEVPPLPTSPPVAAEVTAASQKPAWTPFIATSQTWISSGQRGSGEFVRSGLELPVAAAKARVLRYAVFVESDLVGRVDPQEVAHEAHATLSDPRGWASAGYSFALVADPAQAEFVIYLATPTTVDKLCSPLKTDGRVNCRSGKRVVLNADRWLHGVPQWVGFEGYRQYQINHEVGHFLGFGHRTCPGRGQTAPIMLQQSGPLSGCQPNAWPGVRR